MYAGAALAFMVIVNENAQLTWYAAFMLIAASSAAGYGINWWPAFLLAAGLIPLSLSFGYSNDYVGSDAPSVLLLAEIWAPLSATAILVGTAMRRVADRQQAEQQRDVD